MDFNGTYEHSLDAKNRLTIPAHQRDELKATGVVLAKGIDRCVALWQPDGYAAFREEALAGLSRLSPDWRKLQRYLNANSIDTELDSAGRVLLPSFLIEHANISKEVTLAGAGDYLEIWDRADWQRQSTELDDSISDITALLGRQG